MRRALAVLLVALPGVAEACAVCGAAVERNRSAFFGTTVMLSLLPLALLGGGLLWLRRQGIRRAHAGPPCEEARGATTERVVAGAVPGPTPLGGAARGGEG